MSILLTSPVENKVKNTKLVYLANRFITEEKVS